MKVTNPQPSLRHMRPCLIEGGREGRKVGNQGPLRQRQKTGDGKGVVWLSVSVSKRENSLVCPFCWLNPLLSLFWVMNKIIP